MFRKNRALAWSLGSDDPYSGRGVSSRQTQYVCAICIFEWRPSRCLQGVVALNTQYMFCAVSVCAWRPCRVERPRNSAGFASGNSVGWRGASSKLCAEVTALTVRRRAGTSNFSAEVATFTVFPAVHAPVCFVQFPFASGDPLGVSGVSLRYTDCFAPFAFASGDYLSVCRGSWR